MRRLLASARDPLLLALLTLVLYWPALSLFFSLDDFEFLMRAAGLAEAATGLRRVLSTRLFFDAAWRLFGTNPLPYHVLLLVLHFANGWLLLGLARRLGLGRGGALAAAALFIATPVAFTPLHWISGVQELSMAFFALLAARFFVAKGPATAAAALVAFLLAMLCKESALLLLPGLALILPGTRARRWTVGVGGLLLGAAVLVGTGAFVSRPAGDPYEAAYGMNLLWNLLTYLAWVARAWDVFPDRVPEFQPALAAWGALLPVLLGLAALRFRGMRASLGRAALLFLLLLLPVLPLLRHSYFYYLYLPLVPLWLLAGAGLEKLSLRRARMALILVLLFVLGSSYLGKQRREAELAPELALDPVLRYGNLAATAVASLRESPAPKGGDMLVLVPFVGESADLSRDLRMLEGGRRFRFLPVERALLGGKALRLFFPALESVSFAFEQVPEGEAWKGQNLFWTRGAGTIEGLGYGEKGRHALSRLYFRYQEWNGAEQEIRALLDLHPGDPNLLYDLGALALRQGKDAELDSVFVELRSAAEAEAAPGPATRALRDLEAKRR